MYVTRQGDCWDKIAKTVYGSEKHTGFLMQNNMPLLDITIFSAGTQVNTPELPVQEADLPPWRKRL